VQLMGGVFCAQERANDWCRAFEAELALVQKGRPQRVLYCIWKDPWMTVSRDTYIARMLALIGWSIPEVGDVRYPSFQWSDALVHDVDQVLLSSPSLTVSRKNTSMRWNARSASRCSWSMGK